MHLHSIKYLEFDIMFLLEIVLQFSTIIDANTIDILVGMIFSDELIELGGLLLVMVNDIHSFLVFIWVNACRLIIFGESYCNNKMVS